MNLEKLASLSLNLILAFIIYLSFIWVLGVGVASMIILNGRFDLITSNLNFIGMVVGLNTLLIPLMIISYLALKAWFKMVKNNE